MRKLYDEKLRVNSEKNNKTNLNVLDPLSMDTTNQQLLGNRRPFSNGEMFSLLLLIIIIVISLFLAIVIGSLTGKELESIPTWLLG